MAHYITLSTANPLFNIALVWSTVQRHISLIHLQVMFGSRCPFKKTIRSVLDLSTFTLLIQWPSGAFCSASWNTLEMNLSYWWLIKPLSWSSNLCVGTIKRLNCSLCAVCLLITHNCVTYFPVLTTVHGTWRTWIKLIVSLYLLLTEQVSQWTTTSLDSEYCAYCVRIAYYVHIVCVHIAYCVHTVYVRIA